MKLSLNISSLINQLTPRVLKKEKLLALLSCLSKPFETVNSELVSFGNEMELRSRGNAQTDNLEKFLLDYFDEPYGITVFTFNRTTDLLVHNLSENIPVYTRNSDESEDPVYLFNGDEDFEYDFEVRYQTGRFTTEELQIMTGWINLFRPASQRFLLRESATGQ